MKKLFKKIFNRMFLISFFVVLQIAILVFGMMHLSNTYIYFAIFLNTLSVAVVIYILNKSDNPIYKLTWIVPIIAFSFVGGLFYLILQIQTIRKTYRRKLHQIIDESSPYFLRDDSMIEEARKKDPRIANTISYMNNSGEYPAVKKTTTKYLRSGEEKWHEMLAQLKKARRYIFLEYFIIGEGIMWESVLDILKKKVLRGVEVRVLYDGMGSISTLPSNYSKKLSKLGIKCRIFSPYVPFLSAYQNNRDHRKICVIDGRVAFTGGINIADEYVNIDSRFGHWRDTSIMVEGDAAYNFAVMFLQMWRMADKAPVDYNKYRPSQRIRESFQDDGYVIPYATSPCTAENAGVFIYRDIINNAVDYLYIISPYLILDYEFILSLTFAAKRGVDVRIILPQIPDKWYTHSVAVSYFEELIENGIKIYKYTPGFIHSKIFVSDDKTAIVGTINLDYRSLYLHYECAVWMYESGAVKEVLDDFIHVLEAYCQEVTLEESRDINLFRRVLNTFLRLIAPLM